MAHHRPVRLASAMVLLGLLTACSAGASDSEPDERLPAAAAAEAGAAKSAAAADTADEPADETGDETAAGSAVPAEAAATYTRALSEFQPAFDRFAVDYEAATEKMDADAVLAAAASLRKAVTEFDRVVRGLDLGALQYKVDALVALNDDVVTTLDAVGTATSGAQAVRIMEMLPFHEYVLAFSAVADGL